MIAHSKPSRVERLMPVVGKRAGRRSKKQVIMGTEISIAIFSVNRPIWPKEIFKAAADRPARPVRCQIIGAGRSAARKSGVGIINRSESNTAGSVDQESVPGIAEPASDRRFKIDLGLEAVSSARIRPRASEGRAFDIAFDAEDDLIDLVIITNVAAADDTGLIEVWFAADDSAGRNAINSAGGLRRPLIADLTAEIKAGPREDRRWCYWRNLGSADPRRMRLHSLAA